MMLAGIASGLMGTITSSGAPPLAIVMQNVAPATLRATLSCVFFFGAILSLVMLAAVDRFNLAQLRLGLMLVPLMVLGFVASNPLTHMFSRQAVRMMLLTLSALGAIGILVRSWILWA